MKKLCLLLVFVLTVSSSVLVFAEPGKNGNEKDTSKKQAVQMSESNFKNSSYSMSKAEKEASKNLIRERKHAILSSYTQKELDAIKKASADISNADPTATVLSADSIISTKSKFKFDTPPVIKGNRTLVPVRAITEGLGADLKWDSETQQITIIKDSTTIVLILGDNIALVNGEKVALDTNSSTINNRTYVPMRFIMETFKMKIAYEDGTIVIEDPAAATSSSAIETPVSVTSNGAIEAQANTTSNGAVQKTAEITSSGSAIEGI